MKSNKKQGRSSYRNISWLRSLICGAVLLVWVAFTVQLMANTNLLSFLPSEEPFDNEIMETTAQQTNSSSSTSSKNHPIVPVIIISSIRPQYLKIVMESVKNQIPTTPSWILGSPRYLFVHHHNKNENRKNAAEVKALAEQYGYQIRMFWGLHQPKAQMNVNANHAWYQMMSYLFFEELEIKEALILEDDVPLAPDALFVTSAMLQYKWKVQQEISPYKNKNDEKNIVKIHGCALGGWSGENRINADPHTVLAVRPQYFHPMAYTMDSKTFGQIMRQKATSHHKTNNKQQGDWAMEMVLNEYVADLTQLTPSMSRMRHIGQFGLGESGKGGSWELHPDLPWEYWKDELANTQISRTNNYYRLDPPQVTDVFGFICHSPKWHCGLPDEEKAFPLKLRMGVTTNISRTKPIPAQI